MKKFNKVLALASSLISSFLVTDSYSQATKRFTLNGSIEGTGQGMLHLNYLSNDKKVTDSTRLENNAFTFSGNVEEPTLATLSFHKGAKTYDIKNMIDLYIEPGMTTLFGKEGEINNAQVNGGRTQTEHQEYENSMKRLRAQWKIVMDTLSAINKRSNFAYQETKAWALKPYYANIADLNNQFIKKYPFSFKTLSLISQSAVFRQMKLDSAMELYKSFPAEIRNSTAGKSFVSTIEKEKVMLTIGAVGSSAADFAKTDINGSKISLYDYKGKYVLLDFWASWCLPCRKGNPHLIALYNKYKSKGFEIIGVSDDDGKPEAWKKAVSDDQIGIWKHVLRGFDREMAMKPLVNVNDLSNAYNIQSLPTKILINPNGKIIGRYGGGEEKDEDLDKKLASLLDK